MEVRYRFTEKKATQAAAYLIKLNGGVQDKMKLIKLLYLANRESFSKWHQPIVADRYFSMPHGPVLSGVLNAINERPAPDGETYWNEFISPLDGYDVRTLAEESPTDELSKRELRLLEEIHDRFRTYSPWQLRNWCHSNLREWKDPGTSSIEISSRDIFAALGFSKADIDSITADERQHQKEAEILSGASTQKG